MALAAQGLQNNDIAERLGAGQVQVARSRERYLESGLPGMEGDLPRGSPPLKVKRSQAGRDDHPEHARGGHALEHAHDGSGVDMSASTAMRHWHANGLKPHLVRSFKVSRDPKFAEKLEDIVGRYLSPPEHALVLCCDEKSQVQAPPAAHVCRS